MIKLPMNRQPKDGLSVRIYFCCCWSDVRWWL